MLSLAMSSEETYSCILSMANRGRSDATVGSGWRHHFLSGGGFSSPNMAAMPSSGGGLVSLAHPPPTNYFETPTPALFVARRFIAARWSTAATRSFRGEGSRGWRTGLGIAAPQRLGEEAERNSI